MRRVAIDPDLLDGIEAASELILPAEPAHYIRDVLRLGLDAELELFDGRGKVARGRITSTGDEVVVQIEKVEERLVGESPLSITLFQALPKGKRFDWILEKATELGVSSIVALQTERTVVQIPAGRVDGRLERWEKIAASAARQSGRSVIPRIESPRTPQQALDAADCDLHLVAHPGAATGGPQQYIKNDEKSVGVWIGPEGGFTQEELDWMLANSFRPISLGPRILRADTAGIVAMALLQAACGDL